MTPAVVVVVALDRFGRRMLERVRCREELKALGVTTHSVREGGEVSDLVANILASVAQEEVTRLGMRIKSTRPGAYERAEVRPIGGRSRLPRCDAPTARRGRTGCALGRHPNHRGRRQRSSEPYRECVSRGKTNSRNRCTVSTVLRIRLPPKRLFVFAPFYIFTSPHLFGRALPLYVAAQELLGVQLIDTLEGAAEERRRSRPWQDAVDKVLIHPAGDGAEVHGCSLNRHPSDRLCRQGFNRECQLLPQSANLFLNLLDGRSIRRCKPIPEASALIRVAYLQQPTYIQIP